MQHSLSWTLFNSPMERLLRLSWTFWFFITFLSNDSSLNVFWSENIPQSDFNSIWKYCMAYERRNMFHKMWIGIFHLSLFSFLIIFYNINLHISWTNCMKFKKSHLTGIPISATPVKLDWFLWSHKSRTYPEWTVPVFLSPLSAMQLKAKQAHQIR